MSLVPKKRGFFWRASTLQALIETWLLGGVILLGLTFGYDRIGPGIVANAIFFAIPLIALWDALRLRVPEGPGLARHLWHEGRAALSLSPLAAGSWLLALWALGRMPMLNETSFGSLGAILLIFAASPFFLVFRCGVRVWLYWERLRRRRLVWTLTHIQIQLVLAVAILGSIVASVLLVIPAGKLPWQLDTWVFTILPFLGVAGVMTLIGIAAILPPAFFFSWLATRKTTRRLEALAQATGALRRGEYETRILVEGQDEVAQLQGDFNAMAVVLEQAMRGLEAERDKVSELLDARRQLVANVSHELRTPLATLRGYLESVRQHVETTVESREEAIEGSFDLERDLVIMEREVVRLQRLIDDLLTLSRAEIGGLTLDIRLVDLTAAIQRRVDAVAPLAWQRDRVRVVVDVPKDLPRVRADEDRFEQIMVNLLRNALRHTPPGGIIAVSAAVEAEAVSVRVCDTGQGIPVAEQAQIWERFYRGDDARALDVQGAGLGLALVKELTEAMGGEVAVESEPGAGSCFIVWLLRQGVARQNAGLVECRVPRGCVAKCRDKAATES